MKLYNDDCLKRLKTFPDNSIDSVVTDPPYGLSFMNKKWDYDVPSVEIWREVLRVLKPGGHLLSFGGTRTYHRMVVNIEDAGFEIRDQIQWLYGSGFPKSHNISKGIDKKFKAKREIVGTRKQHDIRCNSYKDSKKEFIENITAPSTDLAKKWDGFGTALKPANEPIVLARKPLSEKTIVDNVLKWGTGGINIDGCRIQGGGQKGEGGRLQANTGSKSQFNGGKHNAINDSQGRFPANILLDESAAEMLDAQSGPCKTGDINNKSAQSGFSKSAIYGSSKGIVGKYKTDTPTGASRFFYCAKSSKSERNAGLEDITNGHPTVKPLKLMQYLTRLITPPNGTVLDPFMGSGTTGLACKNEGFNFIGTEMDKDYFEIAKKRIEAN